MSQAFALGDSSLILVLIVVFLFLVLLLLISLRMRKKGRLLKLTNIELRESFSSDILKDYGVLQEDFSKFNDLIASGLSLFSDSELSEYQLLWDKLNSTATFIKDTQKNKRPDQPLTFNQLQEIRTLVDSSRTALYTFRSTLLPEEYASDENSE